MKLAKHLIWVLGVSFGALAFIVYEIDANDKSVSRIEILADLTNDSCINNRPFPDPDMCMRYYQCVSVQSVFYIFNFECPEGGYYDDAKGFCTEGACSNRSLNSEFHHLIENTETENNSDIPIIESRTSSTRYNCQANGTFIDPEDSSKYFLCIEIKGTFFYYVYTCPENACYDKIKKFCRPNTCPATIKEETYSPSELPSAVQLNCTSPGIFPYPSSCNRYYRCIVIAGNMQAYEYTCAAMTYYDPTIQLCVVGMCPTTATTNLPLTTQVIRDTTPTVTETTISQSSTTGTSQPLRYSCTEPGYFADPFDCKAYYECFQANSTLWYAYIYQCPSGTYYSSSPTGCLFGKCPATSPTTVSVSDSETTPTTTIVITTGITSSPAPPTSVSLITANVTTSIPEETSTATTAAISVPVDVSTSETTSAAISETTSDSLTEATSESTSETMSEYTSEATSESTSETRSESTSEVTSESTSKATAESTSETTSESTSKTTSESTSGTTSESTSEATSKLTSEATSESTTGAIFESTSESSPTKETTPGQIECTNEIRMEDQQIYTSCGENIVADSGIIRYKYQELLEPGKGCLWLIRSNLNSQVTVRLVDDGFSSNSQRIEISKMFLDGEIGGFFNYSMLSGDYAPRIVAGPVILINYKFYDPYNTSPNATGFVLQFQGCGPEISNPPAFTHYYRERSPNDLRQVISYPDETLNSYLPNQFVTYLGLRTDRLVNYFDPLSDWKVTLTYQDIIPSNYCLYGDNLQFYSGGLSQYPAVDVEGEFIWRFCSRNNTTRHIIPALSSKYGNIFPTDIGILIVFTSNGYEEGKGFTLEW